MGILPLNPYRIIQAAVLKSAVSLCTLDGYETRQHRPNTTFKSTCVIAWSIFMRKRSAEDYWLISKTNQTNIENKKTAF